MPPPVTISHKGKIQISEGKATHWAHEAGCVVRSQVMWPGEMDMTMSWGGDRVDPPQWPIRGGHGLFLVVRLPSTCVGEVRHGLSEPPKAAHPAHRHPYGVTLTQYGPNLDPGGLISTQFGSIRGKIPPIVTCPQTILSQTSTHQIHSDPNF